MATLEFGAQTKTADEFIAEIYTLIGAEFPLGVVVIGGELKQVTAQTTWKEGDTTPIEEEVDGEIVVTGYEENYSNKSLTPAQITLLNTYMQENITQ